MEKSVMIYAIKTYSPYHRPMQSAQLQTAALKNNTPDAQTIQLIEKFIGLLNLPPEESKKLKDQLIARFKTNNERTNRLRHILVAFVDKPEKLATKLKDIIIALIRNPTKQSKKILDLLLGIIKSPENPPKRYTEILLAFSMSPNKTQVGRLQEIVLALLNEKLDQQPQSLINQLLDILKQPGLVSYKELDALFRRINKPANFPNGYINLFKDIGEKAAEFQRPIQSWLPDLKALDMSVNKRSIDPATGTIKMNKRFAWTVPSFRYVHVLTKPNHPKAWIIPMQADKVDAHPDDMENFHLALSGHNLDKYKALTQQGYTSQGVWLQCRAGKPVSHHDPSYLNTMDFVGDISQWIVNEIKNPSANTIKRDKMKSGATPYVMFIRLPTSKDPKKPNYDYFFAKVILSPNGAIQNIWDCDHAGIIDLLFSKLTHCSLLRSNLEDIPGMQLSIDYNGGATKSQPERKVLTINPSRARHGIYDGFMGLLWHIAFHVTWHGDDPATLYRTETNPPLHKNILTTPFEQFKGKFHAALGKANSYVLNFLEAIKGTENEELYDELTAHRNKFFTTMSGYSILAQVQQYDKANEPTKSGALIDPEGKLAKAVYDRLLDDARHPMP
jgi:hypothetical protein